MPGHASCWRTRPQRPPPSRWATLQLSGHTHGGQFFPWGFFVRLQQPYTGLHRHGKMWIYIRRGRPAAAARAVRDHAAAPAAPGPASDGAPGGGRAKPADRRLATLPDGPALRRRPAADRAQVAGQRDVAGGVGDALDLVDARQQLLQRLRIAHAHLEQHGALARDGVDFLDLVQLGQAQHLLGDGQLLVSTWTKASSGRPIFAPSAWRRCPIWPSRFRRLTRSCTAGADRFSNLPSSHSWARRRRPAALIVFGRARRDLTSESGYAEWRSNFME